MHIESDSYADLRGLLIQLARFFSDNEDRISAAEASNCLERLSPIESSALSRLFSLLRPCFLRAVLPEHEGRSVAKSPPLRGRSSNSTYTEEHLPSPPGCDPGQCSNEDNNYTTFSLRPTQERASPLSLAIAENNCLHQARSGSLSIARATPALQEPHDSGTPELSFSEQATLCPQSTPNARTAFPALEIGALAVHPSVATATHPGFDDDTLNKSQLATCSDITPAPSMRRLLDDCKADRGVFLRRVKESKAALPTGQGWKAAIATKSENAEMRDLLKVYHRFECYNIYQHVVEAGIHTGEHWVREKRYELSKKLCQDFPERFESMKAANKSLNWVDQGCKFYEWTKMFGQVSGLGILVALPSGVPHSAYTSRCTKDQMSAASVKFMALGIGELMQDLELSALGNQIAQELREMTTKKRTRIDEPGEFQGPRKSPRITPPSGPPAIIQSSQNMTLPEAPTTTDGIAMLDSDAFPSLLDAFLGPDDTCSNYHFSSALCSDIFMNNQISPFSLPIDEWLQPPYGTDCQTAK